VVKPLPIVLFGEKYWKSVVDFKQLVAEGTIDEEDINLFVYADKAIDAWNYIEYFYKAKNNSK
jgi:predicted Rossmann-fold nucleotide-binding protein